MVTTIDKFGRIIIPKKFRSQLGISFETTLNISEDGEKIIIELVQENAPIVDKNGILVFTGKLESKVDVSIDNDRNIRMKKLLDGGY
ncbi:MAG: AbrB/MazE/SpoVT family DNA-binding domain-containing protein [Melioribacteraceae bacterium]|nr:AbrB/MazE/SpoVT family DNA-binding domain-containing protein [Melioribacteraceae bacterium]